MSPYTYNSSNEMAADPVGSYTYDANGNMLTKPDGTAYTWDVNNRLSQVTLPGTGGTVTFKYDPFGRRVQKAFTVSGTTTTTNYVYDGPSILETTDQSGSVLARYIQGQGIDEPLAETASSTMSYYEQDGLGSVSSLSNSIGALANTYTYDSFGNLTTSTGTLTSPFQYTGREFDPETSLYFYRARYIDQNTGRFISEDPSRGTIDGSQNLYLYAFNNVANYVDPSGLYILKPGVPQPAGALAALLSCTENCLGSIITITSTSEPIPQHPARSPHGQGVAADIHYPNNPQKLLCCASQCGAGFGQDEGAHPSAHSTAPHVHIQIPAGTHGGHGDLPPVKPCSNCQ